MTEFLRTPKEEKQKQGSLKRRIKAAERGSPLFFPLKMQLKKKAEGTLLYIIIFKIIN